MNHPIVYLILGLAGGVASGLFGIGGGIILIPALVYLCRFSQHEAQGTTLAILLLPVGALAVWQYHRAGYVHILAALMVSLGFLMGGYLGSKLAIGLTDAWLRKGFGGLVVLIGLSFFFGD